MKPQHLLAAITFLGGIAIVDSFAITSTPQCSFVARSSTSACQAAASLRMDLESDIDERTRRAVERTLVETKFSFDRLNVGSSVETSTASLKEAQSAHDMPWRTSIGSTDYAEDPLPYMDFWEWQMSFMMSSLTNLRPDDCETAEFGYKDNLRKKARIVNQCYTCDEYRKIRMTYYDAGDNTQVFNSVWYPDPKYNLPVLGVDLLAFNRKKYLAIVDFQPLHENEADHATAFENRLKPIKAQYEALKGKMSSKFYDETQFFSQQMLFARFEDETIIRRELFPAFKRYVQTHHKMVRETIPDMSKTGQDLVIERQSAYDTYSAERDPATGLFAAMFGKQWADDFVYDFLFSLSERKEGGIQIPPIRTNTNGGGPPSLSGHHQVVRAPQECGTTPSMQ